MNRILLILTFLMAALTAVCADSDKVVKVQGVATYFGGPDDSPAICRRKALEMAKIEALRRAFGTNITQDIYQNERIDNRRENTYFNALSSSEVNGEWIADDGAPDYKSGYDADGNLNITCTVKGSARRISNRAVDFKALVLRNGTEERFADTRFRPGDDLFLLFSTPEAGFLAAYLVDDEDNVVAMLPYTEMQTGVVPVGRDREYVFFDKKHADSAFGRPDEYSMTFANDMKTVEYDRLYIVFSPARFSKALDRNDGSGMRVLGHADFQRWLSDNRRRDPQMSVKIIPLTLERN